MALNANSKSIIKYVQETAGDYTANDIASALGLTPRQVNGSLTAFQKKGLIERVEAEVENADGTHDKVKLIVCTEDGRAFDADAE